MSAIVVYFSYSGVTKRAAERLAEKLGADSFAIEAERPYSAADVNWRDKSSRNVREFEDAGARPKIAALPELSAYDQVYVAYPIWWYIQPRIINSFFDCAALEGKTIHLRATSGGSGIERSLAELRRSYPELHIADGRML